MLESVIIKHMGEDSFSFNMSVIKTNGNFSYIPLNLTGTPSENQRYILAALAEFEKRFSLQIIWHVIEKHNVWSLTYGIWVTHQPKQSP